MARLLLTRGMEVHLMASNGAFTVTDDGVAGGEVVEPAIPSLDRQWFTTPGVRVLYLMRQSWTDAAIPLTITPTPDEALRVMMIRVEVITPEVEQVDAAMAKLLGDPASAAKEQARFEALGRFAEPRLRRAPASVGDATLGQDFLAAITSADTRAGVGE